VVRSTWVSPNKRASVRESARKSVPSISHLLFKYPLLVNKTLKVLKGIPQVMIINLPIGIPKEYMLWLIKQDIS